MATQVPYSPIPEVSPQLAPTPTRQINTPPDAFGAAVAQATEHLGQVAEGAGNELFNRAYALQELHNDSIATAANAQYTQQASELQAKFDAAEGINAGPEALTQHEKNLEDLRQSVGQNLTNPMTQKLYNDSTRSFQNRLFFSSAGHSAQAVKQYAIQTSSSTIQSLGDTVAAMPTDDDNFAAAKAGAIAQANHIADLHGIADDDPARTQGQIAAISNITSRRLLSEKETQPFTAYKMMQDAISSGDLRGEDIAKVQPQVTNAVLNTGPRILSGNIASGKSTTLGDAPVDIKRAEDAITFGVEDKGGDPSIKGPVITSGPSKGQYALGLFQVMNGNLQPWLKEAGMQPMTEDEYLHDAAAQKQLFDFKFSQYMKQTGSFNDAASMWFTGHTRATAPMGVQDQLGTTVPGYLSQTNARLSKTASVDDKVAAATKDAGDLAGVPFFQQALQARLTADTEIQNKDELLQQRTQQNLLESALSGIGGKPVPTDIDHLIALGPEYKAAVGSLLPSQLIQLKKDVATAAATDNIPTDSRTSNYTQWFGKSFTDPDTFMKQRFMSVDLTGEDRQALLTTQKKMIASGGTNPDTITSAALRSPAINGLLVGLGITPQSKEDYDQFVGTFSREVTAFQQEKQRAPNREEQTQIATTLLSSPKVPFMGFGPKVSGDYAYKGAPSGFIARIKSEHPDYTEDHIQHLFYQAMFSELYGANK